ncbi:MAG: hypothetical protein IK077_12640 [Thermoguttaceae bacterium]|nr:hypothetical protein [Thermoguttaceae bacterium]
MSNSLFRFLATAVFVATVVPAFAQISERNPSDRTPDPAKTENFRSKGYGVFVHYLDGLQNGASTVNSLGKETSWNECVDEFDVELFANQIAETGAGYVFFTVMQQTRSMPAPNATFDRLTGYKPGEACSKRDLIMEIADALEARGIDLYLYWTGDGPLRDPQAFEGLKGSIPVTKEYMQNWSDVVAEYGRRYGTKVKGWWIDGSYSWIGHNEETREILAQGLRAGNPDRILAFNPGVDPKVMAYSDCDDFTAGEQNSFESIPETGRFLKGAQWHILTFLGEFWGKPGCKLTKSELAQYVWTVNRRGGVVSIDVVLYRDGGLDRSQLETLKALRPALEAKKEALQQRRDSGNLAADALAFLRSADEQRALIPSVGLVHAADKGVDGDPNTAAVGGGEWSWAYCVELTEPGDASKIELLFGGGYPTDFEVFVKADDADWDSLGRIANPDGQREYEFNFDKRKVSAVKVVAWKPDGPDQPGVQMSVAELSVF